MSESIKNKKQNRKVLKSLRLCDKIKIIEQRDKGVSRANLALKYQVDPSTISRIMKDQEKIMMPNKNVSRDGKRIVKCKYEQVNQATWQWFIAQRSKGVSIGGSHIQQQAIQFAKRFDCLDFKASNGWLSLFLRKNNIVLKEVKGEKLSADEKAEKNLHLNENQVLDWLECDDQADVSTEDDIISGILNEGDDNNNETVSLTDDNDCSSDISSKQALEAIDLTLKYLSLKKNIDLLPDHYQNMINFRDDVLKKRNMLQKQLKVTDFSQKQPEHLAESSMVYEFEDYAAEIEVQTTDEPVL